ncbi:MAG: discoidin domain-containing protein [Spirochaetales bacterium]|nr:discoidin domain-containing protein [Spirochaetales bacterium]
MKRCFFLLFLIVAFLAHAQEANKYFENGGIYFISSSHQDVGWMDDINSCKEFRINECIFPAIELAKKDSDYRFTMENMLNLEEFLEVHPEFEELIIEMTSKGQLEWGATYTQPYEGFCSGEQLIRQNYFGRRWLMKNFPGCDAKVAFNPDVPGRTLQSPQILKKSGIPYLVISRFHDGNWKWVAPDGSSVLVHSPSHYTKFAESFTFGQVGLERKISEYLKQKTPEYEKYGIAPALGALYSTDFSRPSDFRSVIDSWNKNSTSGKLQYSSALEFFKALNANKDARFPEIKGERPNLWVYIHGPGHLKASRAARNASIYLPFAEIFSSISAVVNEDISSYPSDELNKAWKALVYPDHGWGGNQGHNTDAVFLEKYQSAEEIGQRLSYKACEDIATVVGGSIPGENQIVVFNGMSYDRKLPVRIKLKEELLGYNSYGLKDSAGEKVSYVLDEISSEYRNIALASSGTMVKADSSYDSNHSAEKLIDGRAENDEFEDNLQRSDSWWSAPKKYMNEIVLDFGEVSNIDSVVLKHVGVLGEYRNLTEMNIRNYKIYGSSDGKSWKLLVSPIVCNNKSITFHSIPRSSVRYLKVLIRRSLLQNESRLMEIEAWGMKKSSEKYITFIADVEGVGYNSYYISGSDLDTPSSLDKVVNNALPTYENKFYKIAFAHGGISSIFDKEQNCELLNTEKFLAGEVFTLRSIGNGAGEFSRVQQPDSFGYASTSQTSGLWEKSENNLFAEFEYKSKVRGITVVQNFLVYKDIKKIDFNYEIKDWNGEKNREWRTSFPFVGDSTSVRYQVPMGIVEVGKDEIPMTGGHAYGSVNYDEPASEIRPREVRNFIMCQGENYSAGLTSDVSAFDYKDPINSDTNHRVIQHLLFASRKSCHWQGNWYFQAGTHNFSFSFTSSKPDWRSIYQELLSFNHPLISVFKRNSGKKTVLNQSGRFLSFDASNLIVSTIKKAEDTNDFILRIYDMEGVEVEAKNSGLLNIKNLESVDMLEFSNESSKQNSGFVVGSFSIETFKINLEI